MTIKIVKLPNHNVHIRYYNTRSVRFSSTANERYIPRRDSANEHVHITLLIHDESRNYVALDTYKLIDKMAEHNSTSDNDKEFYAVGKYGSDYLIAKRRININDCVIQSNASITEVPNKAQINGLVELIDIALQYKDQEGFFIEGVSDGKLKYLEKVGDTHMYIINNDNIALHETPQEVDNYSTRQQEENDEEEKIKEDSTLDVTEKKQLISARWGQGEFRKRVLELRENHCLITGIETEGLLIASHIQPWRIGDNNARLDPHNGLLLAATYDKLFDQGYITFDQNGMLQISEKLSSADREKLLLNSNIQREFSERTLSYLKYHFNHIYKG